MAFKQEMVMLFFFNLSDNFFIFFYNKRELKICPKLSNNHTMPTGGQLVKKSYATLFRLLNQAGKEVNVETIHKECN